METWSHHLDLPALAGKFPTPCYVLNLEQLERNFRAYVDWLGAPSRVLYPVKANPAVAVLRRLARLGAGADCAAKSEVELALHAGIPLERIVYNTPAPELRYVITLLLHGATVVIDSEEMLRAIDTRLDPKRVRGSLYLRVNPEVSPAYADREVWQDLTAHAGQASKFGVPAEDVVRVLSGTRHAITGLHLHVGTQMDNLATFGRALEALHALVDMAEQKTHQHLRHIDIGGGLGIPFTADKTFPTISELGAYLKPKLRAHLVYAAEPGHSLIGDAVGLLTRVVTLKQVRHRRWAITDVGTDQLAKVTLLRWPHQILDTMGRALPMQGPDAVGGPLCFAGDTLLAATDLTDVRVGDPLFVQHCGAYCYALRNPFNGRASPAHVVVRDSGEATLACEPEDTFASTNLLGADWTSEGAETELSLARIDKLSSTYLRTQARHDVYRFVRAERHGAGSYLFDIDTEAAVDFVSMPFAIRIAGDAVIVAVCERLGKATKDIDILGTRLWLSAEVPLAANRRLRCHVDLSAATTFCRYLAKFDLDGKFKGAFQVTLKE